MKTKALLFLAALGLVVSTSAIAAQPRLEAEVVVLPTYVVSVPRYRSFEKQMHQSLNEIRQQAHLPMATTLAMPFSQSMSREQKVTLNAPRTQEAQPVSKS